MRLSPWRLPRPGNLASFPRSHSRRIEMNAHARRIEVGPWLTSRERVAKLLARYPDVSKNEDRELLEFMKTGATSISGCSLRTKICGPISMPSWRIIRSISEWLQRSDLSRRSDRRIPRRLLALLGADGSQLALGTRGCGGPNQIGPPAVREVRNQPVAARYGGSHCAVRARLVRRRRALLNRP